MQALDSDKIRVVASQAFTLLSFGHVCGCGRLPAGVLLLWVRVSASGPSPAGLLPRPFTWLNVNTYMHLSICVDGASQVALVVKKPPASARDVKDAGSIPGLGRPPGGGHGNPLQYSCLENPHGQRSLEGYTRVTKSRTRLK